MTLITPPYICLSVCTYVCASHYLPLNHGTEFYQTCYITSSHGKCMREQYYFFHVFVRPFACCPSICLSRYLLNHKANFNQTCCITSSDGKGVREQYYFSVRPSLHPSSVHLSVKLSPPKPLGGIQPILLHHFPAW